MEIPKLPNDKKSNHIKNAAMLSGSAFEMGAIIYFANKGGIWLDNHFETNNEVFRIIATLTSVAISLWAVVIPLKKIKV